LSRLAPGHFVIVETWRDQTAIDAHAGALKQLRDARSRSASAITTSGFHKTLMFYPPPPPPNSRAVSVVSHVDVALDPRVPMMLKKLAEDSRQEDGNVRFDVIQHTMRANHFTVIETWQNNKTFDAHSPPRIRSSIGMSRYR
jgi:quinol monooxygenase YgiN